ncbi:MAG: hypothetical protein ACE5GO_01645 [Anaerolineales bacterium]
MTIRFNEKGKFFTDVVTKIALPVIIQTTNYRIHGSIHIHQNIRIKDMLNRVDEDFIAVTDANVVDSHGHTFYQTYFIAISRKHIVWIIPSEEIKTDEHPPGNKT